MSLNNHTALITGAGQGIGQACAEVFAERGARLVLLDKNEETLSAVIDKLAKQGARVTGRVLDLTETEVVTKTIEEIQGFAVIDILVNNAGADRPGTTSRITKEDLEWVLDVHLGVSFVLIKLLLPAMKTAQWGRIINIGSVYGMIGAKGQVAYCTAKAGMVGLSKAVAREAGQHGVTVNTVVPGLIRTPPIEAMLDKHKAPILAETVLGRSAEPAEVARVIAFLASNDASFITGATIPVSGGWGA